MKIKDYHLGDQEIDTSKPGLLVCDIDGTIADLSHRRPYIATKPKNYKAFKLGIPGDKPITWVIDIVQELYNNDWTVVLASGREGDNWGRTETVKWLKSWFVPYTQLYMREAKDYRKDYIIKDELRQRIEADYGHIDLVLDDRDQVVEMWRGHGIRCIQVAEGNF